MCKRSYSQRYNLLRHVQLECNKGPQFQCPYCSHKYKRRNVLRGHVFTVHSIDLNEINGKIKL